MNVRCLGLMVVLSLSTPIVASAQDLYGQVGPAAMQIMDEGLDGSPDSVPRIIEIFNAYGVDLDISPWEARDVIERSRYDRDRSRIGGLTLVGFQRAADTCADMRAKAGAASRLSRGLMFASQLNAIGAGISLATGAGAPFAVPFGIASTVTGFASSWAGQLASAYTSAANTAGCGMHITYEELPWNEPQRPHFHTPTVWRGLSGLVS